MTEDMLNSIAVDYHYTDFVPSNPDLKAVSVYHNICIICGHIQDSTLFTDDQFGSGELLNIAKVTPIGNRAKGCDRCEDIQKRLPSTFNWVMSILAIHGLVRHVEPEFTKPRDDSSGKLN